MKKLTILVCVLAMLLAFTGVASASEPEPGTFTIIGYTTSYEYDTLPSGLTKFHLKAMGDVTGDFEGTFTFNEWGIIDPASGRGINFGIMTITTNKGNMVITFGGQTDSLTVWGRFRVLYGTGDYRGLRGWGTYTGEAALVFTVEFTSRFYTARR